MQASKDSNIYASMFSAEKHRLIKSMDKSIIRTVYQSDDNGFYVAFYHGYDRYDYTFTEGRASDISNMRDLTNMFNNSTPKGAA